MQAEIISIGTELLLGEILNTNAQYLSKKLAEMGISVYHQAVVGDNGQRIKEAFSQAFTRSQLVITTGGLGPTKDDISKEMVAEYFGREMQLDQQSLADISLLFQKNNWQMSEYNKKQAYFPVGAHILKNTIGTAPGCIVEGQGKIAILLPGPPEEMTNMFENEVVPYLSKHQSAVIYSKVLRLYGIGESSMAEAIEDIIEAQTNPTVAPYAKEYDQTLRITAKAENELQAKALILPLEEKIRVRLSQYIYGEGETGIEEVVAQKLQSKGVTISVAESCTGGLLAAKLVDYPGASEFFLEGAVTYSNEAKVRRLNVKQHTLDRYGAVSPETAMEMAKGIAASAGTDIGIATTGIAGPTGGTPEKPVGLVYIGLFVNGDCKVKKINAVGDRNNIRNVTVMEALHWLKKELE
ncbi:competence/damage-inducible protein A [Peptococcaceae bacterium 1198_IL3148]